MASFPYLARTTLKYKSPHATDLSFAKDETIRVTGPSEHDEDWLTGETLDGSKSGGFPKDFIVPIEPEDMGSAESAKEEVAASQSQDPPMPKAAPAPPSPKLEPAKLPPSTTASPAPASAPPPPTAATTTTEGEDEPAKRSMKDRLAFFAAAQNKAAPPPPIKPKPAAGGLTWSQRQKLRQDQEAKEREAGDGTTSALETPTAAAPAPAAPVETITAPSAAAGGGEEKKAGAGLSAADAQSSIGKGGSLKERMAALRGAGAFGAPETKAAPPPPVKLSGKVWSRPAAPEPEAGAEEGDEAIGADKSSADTVEAEDGGAVPAAQEEGEEPEQTEEEQEKARRAAIAARMAKLGARGPMGMAPPTPPKPVRRPTKDTESSSPTVEKSEPVPTPLSQPVTTQAEVKPNEPEAQPDLATSPPQSVAMPAIPRRTAGPRRPARPAAATSAPKDDQTDLEKRVEKVHPDGTISPPAAVMVANEEPPLPRTDQQLEREKEHEEIGKGEAGMEGAKAAGIALAPPSNEAGTEASTGGTEKASSPPAAPQMVPLHSPAPYGPQATRPEVDEEYDITPGRSLSPAQAILGLPKDEVEMKRQHNEESGVTSAQGDDIADATPPPPRRISMDKPSGPRPLPSTPGKEDGANRTSLPPPPTRSAMIPPRDDGEDEEDEEVRSEEEHAPPPPPRRQPSMPLPPRPVPPHEESDEEDAEPVKEEEEEDEEEAPPPPPPVRRPTVPPPPAPVQDDDEVDEEEEEEEPAPPPPPRREPSILPPVQTSAGGIATSVKEPILSSPASPKIANSPTQSKSLSLEQPQGDIPAESETTEEDEDAARRKGIAARMAKLGGIKFGMPPPVPKVKRTNTLDQPEVSSPVAPQQTVPESPMEERSVPTSPIVPTRMPPPVEAESEEGEETPEQEAERRRKTLARLRAGGALGRGMFGQGHAAPAEDEAELEPEQSELEDAESAGKDEDDVAPPPPTARPPVPSNRPLPSAPPPIEEAQGAAEDEAEDAPPPPIPSSRPPVPANRPLPTPSDTEREEEKDDAPPPPPARPSRTATSDIPRSPIRSMSNRPALPSPSLPPPLPPVLGQEATDEPTEMAPRSPERPIRPTPVQTQTNTSENPRRSMSIASISRQSFQSTRSPASPGLGRQDSVGGLGGDSGRPSFAGSRPGFNELQAASQDAGARVLRAAQGLFGQGKRAYLGDGSPAGFVMVVYEQAHLPRPEQSWGQVIYEQEAGSVLKKYDEPRPGDIAAFFDAKLKGKKGLSSYNQHVGSVEDALVGVVSESEQKKHKLRVIQVERGVPEEVSYRCDDLKSGRIVVFRPGM